MRGIDTDADPADGRVSRIQTLLVSVRDIASSLHRLSAQLEREVRPALAGTSHRPGDDGDALSVAALRQENAQLRGALDARAVIEQAKGMLIASHQCSAEEAFELLVDRSQSEQRKVRDIAADMVAGALDPKPAEPPLAVLRAGRSEQPATAGPPGPNGEAPRTPVRIDLAATAERAASARRRGGG